MNNTNRLAVQLLHELAKTRGRQPLTELSRPGLVVTDCQALFCCTSSPAYLPMWQQQEAQVLALVSFFQRQNLPVVFTRHGHPENDSGGLIKRFFGRLLPQDDPLSQLIPSLHEQASRALVVLKSRHSVFSEAAVCQALECCDSVILTGVQTPLCILASAIDAARFDLVPVVVADATAARSEQEHAAALHALACGHSYVASCGEVVDFFS